MTASRSLYLSLVITARDDFPIPDWLKSKRWVFLFVFFGGKKENKYSFILALLKKKNNASQREKCERKYGSSHINQIT